MGHISRNSSFNQKEFTILYLAAEYISISPSLSLYLYLSIAIATPLLLSIYLSIYQSHVMEMFLFFSEF